MSDETALPSIEEAERLLYHEARLLDSVRYEEWLELFTEDALYAVPIDGGEDVKASASSSVAIIYDDAERRSERVWRTLRTPVLDQSPRSRTVHVVSNVEVDPEPVAGDARVYSAQLVTELRPGGLGQVALNEQRHLAARVEHRLRRVDGAWRIAGKTIVLVNREQPLSNLTFVI